MHYNFWKNDAQKAAEKAQKAADEAQKTSVGLKNWLKLAKFCGLLRINEL